MPDVALYGAPDGGLDGALDGTLDGALDSLGNISSFKHYKSRI